MKIVKKPLSALKRPERNVRLHSDKQLAEFKRSVEMFGQIRPIVVDENDVILAGNGLYETLTALGWKEADCHIVTGLSDAGKKKLMLADNRIYSLGVDDMDAFDAIIGELRDDLDIPGYDLEMLQSLVMDEDEVDDLMADYGKLPNDRAEEIRSTETKYQQRDDDLAHNAEEITPAPPPIAAAPNPAPNTVQPADVADSVGYRAPYKAEEAERKFIVCPHCGERIWL